MFFSIYMALALLGGLGFEQDTYSHVTLAQEIIGYKTYLPFFGREYVWLPGYHYLGAFLIAISAKTVAPVYVMRFIAAASSSLTLLITWRWLRLLNVGLLWRIASVLLIGLNGYWLAYSTMSMTDTFSVFLLVGWMYFLDRYLRGFQTNNLIIAAVLALIGVATRYEAWIFMAITTPFLFLRTKNALDLRLETKRKIVAAAAFAVPSVAFIGFWFAYNFLGKGDPLYFTHDPTKFLWSNSIYFHNIGIASQGLLGNLLLTSGLLWVFPFLEAWKGKNRALFVQLSFLVSAYLIFLVIQLYLGVNAGFARYWLPILPISSIAFGLTASRTKNRWFLLLLLVILVVTVLLSLLGLQQILVDHSKYLQAFGSDENRLST